MRKKMLKSPVTINVRLPDVKKFMKSNYLTQRELSIYLWISDRAIKHLFKTKTCWRKLYRKLLDAWIVEDLDY